MNDQLLIKYNGADGSGFDLGLLGVSFTGTSAILKEFSEMMHIDGEVEIRTSQITHSSVDVHNLIVITYTSLPFANPAHLYEFLQVADPEMLRVAKDFFTGTLGVHRTINDYFARYPFDAALLSYLAGKFVVKSFRWAAKQKQASTTRDTELGEISERQARRYGAMVKAGKFRRTLKPLTEGNVSSIKVLSSNGRDSSQAIITENDIEKYLPEEDQILPDFINGSRHNLTGCLVSLQSARGEIIKIEVNEIPRPYSLITARPHDGESTIDYAPFYRKEVTFTAEVVRATMYKRPEFVIIDLDISQTQLI